MTYGSKLKTVLVLLISALSLTCFITPPPAENEMTAKAWESLRFIAEKPRPSGSERIREVETFITDRLTEAGLTPQLFAHETADYAGQPLTVRNIYAEIKGVRDKSVLLLAHYDSVPLSPGAGDNGISVAALLEATAAFGESVTSADFAEGPLTGIKILFTDGEEMGLKGAYAFVENHPELLQEVLFVVNIEGYGNGPITIIQGNGPSDAYFGSVANPMGFSAINGMPTGLETRFDTAPFAAAGIPYLTLGSPSWPWNYDSPGDTVDRMSQRSVAQYTNTVHNLLNRLAQTDVAQFDREMATDRETCFMLAYGLLISYNRVAGGFLVLLTLAAVCAFAVILKKKGANRTERPVSLQLPGIRSRLLSLTVTLGFIFAYVALNWALIQLIALVTWNDLIQIPFDFAGLIVLGFGVAAALFPLSLLYLKKFSQYVATEISALVLAILLAAVGAAAFLALPSIAYLPLFSALLIALRYLFAARKIVSWLTGIAAGVLFLPLLYLTFTSLPTKTLTAALLAVFILVQRALCRDFPQKT